MTKKGIINSQLKNGSNCEVMFIRFLYEFTPIQIDFFLLQAQSRVLYLLELAKELG